MGYAVEGIQEIRELAQQLSLLELGPACLVSGTLPRVRQSAEIIAEILGLPVNEHAFFDIRADMSSSVTPGVEVMWQVLSVTSIGFESLIVVSHAPLLPVIMSFAFDQSDFALADNVKPGEAFLAKRSGDMLRVDGGGIRTI